MTNLVSSVGTELPLLDPVEAAMARLGTLLDAKWQLDALLGRGGMATVNAATNRVTKAKEAVKVLLAELASDADVRERFVREARIANSIQHAARVAVIDEGLSDRGEIFLVMELLDGTTLDVHVHERRSDITLEQKLALFDPVLDLLAECHAAGIVHRDIKPANIFVTATGQVKVLDFGIARLRESKGAVGATMAGTVLGTPAFMAPEQALGLSDLVDGRADLWSVGACMYLLITGQRVHQARSEQESMVLAATRSAESIALVAPDLPVDVVAFVDRALVHDKRRRFPDAPAMRAALASVLASLRSGKVTRGRTEKKRDAVVVRTQITADLDAESSPELREQTLEVLGSVWKHLAHFMSANVQYGAGHSLTLQPMRVALEEIGSALAARPDSLSWDVSPYAFTYAKTPLWDPEKVALERVAFHVFSHGMRKMQLKAGVTEEELRRFLAILTADRGAKLALTDDPVADLWAQRFEHIGHLAIDAFASGTAEDVEEFESEADQIAERVREAAMVSRAVDDAGDQTLEARAMQLNLLAGLNASAAVASSIALDVRTRMLSAQMLQPRARWEERFVDVVAAVLVADEKGLGAAATTIRALGVWTASAVKQGELATAFERFAKLRTACHGLAGKSAAGRRASLEKELATAMFDATTLAAIIHKLQEASADSAGADACVRGVERVLELLGDASFFAQALDGWAASPDAGVGPVLFAYVQRWLAGNEALLARVVENGAAPLALAILDLVKADAKTDPSAHAGVALLSSAGLRSPHAGVRRAALLRLRGGSAGEDIQTELLALLGGPDADLRCETLGVVAKLRLRAVGPGIVRRIQEATFQALEGREKREWLACLHELNAARAEEIVIEMLERAPFFPNDANDKNRIIAAQILAKASTAPALAAAKAAARSTLSNSPLVREAAAIAASAISTRRGESS